MSQLIQLMSSSCGQLGRERERDTQISEAEWKEQRSYNELQIEFLNIIDLCYLCSACLILFGGYAMISSELESLTRKV